MKLRNPVRISETTIDCELEHPDFGWIPYTSMSEGSTQQVYARILNGEAGEIVDNTPSDQSVLDDLKKDAEETIDSEATSARHRYISPDKSATYLSKRDEVVQWIDDGRPETPAEGTYPYIESEAFHTESTVKDTAELIESMYIQWKQLDAAIEGIALGGKAKIRSVTLDATISIQDAEQSIKQILDTTVQSLRQI